MNKRIATLSLALAMATGVSVAFAEGTAPAAPMAAPAGGAGAGPMGPMAGRDGHGKGPMGGPRMMQEKPESFTEETVRKMADGRVIKRQVEQKVGEGSFSRKEVITNPDGKMATRTVTATLNKEKTTWTRKIEGQEFDGSTWSRTQDIPAMRGPDAGVEGAGPADGAKRPAKVERKKGS